MRLFTILAASAFLLVLAEPADAQEQITRADRKAMRQTRDTMRSIAQDLRTLHSMNEEYPAELKEVVDANLRESLPKDGWERDFAYELSDEYGYELTSWGADGAPGGDGGNHDIVWTATGELRELSEEERAEQERIREELHFQGSRVVAKARMVVIGRQLVDHRRGKGEWPESLEELKPDANTGPEKRLAKCFTDPWGNDFELKLLPHENFAVICRGRDGEEGGKGRDADFVVTERDVREAAEQDDSGGGFSWRVYERDWQIRELASSVKEYKEKNGSLPETLEDLVKGGQGEAVRGSIPTDEWGNSFVYVRTDDETFHVVGLGKDQIAGGIDDNKDAMSPSAGGEIQRNSWGVMNDFEEQAFDANEALVEVADETMRNLVEQANAYHAEHGEFPETLEDIEDLLPDQEVPLDPWENSYAYELATNEDGDVDGFTVTCLGSDGAEGGEGTAEDVSYNQDLVRTPAVEDPDEEDDGEEIDVAEEEPVAVPDGAGDAEGE